MTIANPLKGFFKDLWAQTERDQHYIPGNSNGVNCEFVHHGNCQIPSCESYTIKYYFQPKVNNKD